MPLSESQLRELLTEYRRENWKDIQTPRWQQRIVEDYLGENCDGFFEKLAGYWEPRPGAVVLDMGSGVGSFVVACRKRGLLAFGIEPDRIAQRSSITAMEIARQRVDSSAFVVGIGEHLPFKDSIFDLVTLNAVLEHVTNQEAVLRESLRVLKDEGAVYFWCPNYLRFWEPHYKVFWFPLMPKPLGKLYLRLRGRNPVMLDQLTYTTHRMFESTLRNLVPEHDFVDIHRDHFLRKCSGAEDFVSLRGRLVKRLARLPGLGRWILRAVLMLHQLRDPGIEFIVLRRKGRRIEANSHYAQSSPKRVESS